MIEINLDRIEDRYVREVIQRIREDLNNQVFLNGEWKFFELEFTSDITNFKISHKLGYTPKDIVQTSLTGTGTLTYNYSEFDVNNLDMTTASTDSASPLVVRFFAGRHVPGSEV